MLEGPDVPARWAGEQDECVRPGYRSTSDSDSRWTGMAIGQM